MPHSKPRLYRRLVSRMEASMTVFYKSEEIDLLATVMDRASAKMTMTDVDKEILALRILRAAEEGERDPDRLLETAMAA